MPLALVLLTLTSCQTTGVRILKTSRTAPQTVPAEPAAVPLQPPATVAAPDPTPTSTSTPVPDPTPTPTPTPWFGGGGGGGGGAPAPTPTPVPDNKGPIGVTVRLTEPTLATPAP
jgi:hypothetical protein